MAEQEEHAEDEREKRRGRGENHKTESGVARRAAVDTSLQRNTKGRITVRDAQGSRGEMGPPPVKSRSSDKQASVQGSPNSKSAFNLQAHAQETMQVYRRLLDSRRQGESARATVLR